jgi:hypothetical protein
MIFSGFGGYIISVILAWLIQRAILKNRVNRSSAETLFILLWIPVANIIISIIFYFAKANKINDQWILQNLYQIKD